MRFIGINIFSVLWFQLMAGSLIAQPNFKYDGSQLWFANVELSKMGNVICPSSIWIQGNSQTFNIIQNEFLSSLSELFKQPLKLNKKVNNGCVLVATSNLKSINNYLGLDELKSLGNEGFIIRTIKEPGFIIIVANNEIGALYGTYQNREVSAPYFQEKKF